LISGHGMTLLMTLTSRGLTRWERLLIEPSSPDRCLSCGLVSRIARAMKASSDYACNASVWWPERGGHNRERSTKAYLQEPWQPGLPGYIKNARLLGAEGYAGVASARHAQQCSSVNLSGGRGKLQGEGGGGRGAASIDPPAAFAATVCRAKGPHRLNGCF